MSNVQRVTGALFTRVRHVDNILTDVDVRLAAVDALVDSVDAQLRTVDARLDGKLDAVDTMLGVVGTKLDAVDANLTALDHKLNSVIWLVNDHKKKIDEQNVCNDISFAIFLVIGVCIFWTMYTKTHGLCVPMVNVHVVEPVQDRDFQPSVWEARKFLCFSL
jgi:hypothetical protein